MFNAAQGMFQNLDPKNVTFFDVLRHFQHIRENFKYHNCNLDKLAVILVDGLVFPVYVQY